ncbi:hypothetical protein [Lysobacter solisilvae (ex Woo and Kim 2020)]|uniref:DUF3592 domain-containing protein n=1 Tax=Agrilutibacter terrestris TaxID=2865112 RepID=A0A7H0FVX2_9GAMM|nr:hypothetical protein [Lysobacter terrestris]QNP40188.1 hypothetical protein H8B22_11920 [Lysobacter terrestris]
MPHSRRAIAEMILFGVLAALVVAAITYFQHHDRAKVAELSASPVSINGYITETQCNNHRQVSYKYSLAGTEYSDTAHCVESCETAKPGDIVKVLYAANNPENFSCLPISVLQGRAEGDPDFKWLLAMIIMVYGIARAVLSDEARAAQNGG